MCSSDLVGNLRAGDNATLTVLRDGAERKFDVKIGALPANQTADATPAAPAERQTAESRVLGMSLASVTPAERQRYQLPRGAQGVVVTRVAANSTAAEQGIRAGDVIEKVDNATVTSPSEVAAKIDAARKGDKPAVLLLVNRRGASQFVALKTSQA